MIRSIGILIMIAGAVQQPTPADALRRQDVYAIYSTMISNASSSNRIDSSPVFAIAATTKPAMAYDSTPYPCIVPPQEYANRWTEVLTDFNARRDTPLALERELKLSKPYVYLNPDEVSGFVNPQRTTPSQPLAVPAGQERKGVFTLSDVYFNKDRTLALTGVSFWCGSMCSSSHWEIYEKSSDGTWKEVRPSRNCYQEA